MPAVRSIFTPHNPGKYKGEYPIISRSSWELEFMNHCDKHSDVIEWSSEPVKIPYTNPLPSKKFPKGGGQTVYVPDFLVTYLDKSGNRHTKLIEIKPLHEASAKFARNGKDALERARNEAKWGAATQWAMRRGVDFVVMTEADLFANHANRTGRKHPIRAAGKAQVKNLKPRTKKQKTTKPKNAGGLSKASRTARANAKSSISKVRSRKIPKIRKARRV